MATKVDQASPIEPCAQTTITSSVASSNSPKVSMFGVKSGFVIPKNKLSGSLVPVFRRGGKMENHDATEEESNKQVQRKTKWGADLTQDASVGRGRALAYQTRVEQITQQLKSGVLEKEDGPGSHSANQTPSHESSNRLNDDQLEKLEMLELERREAIGEILKLNPSYKAPPDYKPLLKEAKVPVPLKLESGKKFIGLILGPGSNTQKRLEEETGAKIRIQGIKAGMSEKDEIIVSDGNEAQILYDELYVHISADTFEKVDAAVALVELLVTPVSGNPAVSTTPTSSVAEDSLNVFNQSQDTTSSHTIADAVANQGVVQLTGGPAQPGAPQVLYPPYLGPWFPVGQHHTQMLSPVGFTPPSNSSAPMPNNYQFHPATFNSMNRPSFLAGQPPSATGFNLVPRHPSLVIPRPLPPVQGLQWPHMPDAPPSQVPPLRNNPMHVSQPLLPYPSISGQSNTIPHQVTGNQPITTGLAQVPRPPLHSMPRPVASAPLRPLPPTGSFTPVPPGPSMMQRPPPMVMSQGPNAAVAPPVVASSAGFSSPASFSSQPLSSHLPVISSAFASVPSPGRPGQASIPPPPTTVAPAPALLPSPSSGMLQAPSPVAARMPHPPSVFPRMPPTSLSQATMPAPASSSALNRSSFVASFASVMPQGPTLNVSTSPSQGPAPVLPQVPSAYPSATPTSVSGSLPVFTPLMPSMTSPRSIPLVIAPRPQRSSSGDFTFQPRGPPLPGSHAASRPSYQPMHAPIVPPQPALRPPLIPPAQSYQPVVHNSSPKPGIIQGFSPSQSASQMVQSQAMVSAPPSLGPVAPRIGTPSTSQPPPQHAVFPNPNPVMPMSTVPRMGLQGFMQAPQRANLPQVLPPRPKNPPQTQLTPTIQPGNVLAPNRQYSNNPAFSSGKIVPSPGGHQVYDPFSPTSVSSALQRGDSPIQSRKQENDPEYEDLMASVGMR